MSFLIMDICAAAIILVAAGARALARRVGFPKNALLIMWGAALVRLLVPFKISVPLTVTTPAYAGFPLSGAGSVAEAVGAVSAKITDGIASGRPLLLVWAVAAAVLFGYCVFTHLRWLKIYSFAVPSESLYIEGWLASNRLKFRSIRVKVSSDIRSPLTYGVLRPVILIPKHVVSDSGLELDYLLAHELVHVKNFHVLWKWLLLLAACVHWYNPFVWVMYVLANRDLEIICDEAAVRLFDERRAGEYASVLLKLSQLPRPFMPLSNGFGRTSIEERIALIMKKSKIRPLGIIVAAVAVALVVVTLSASGMSITHKSPDELRTVRLSETAAVCNVPNLPNLLFSTDNGEIWVTISGEPRETTSGTFYLYDYDDGLAYIQQIFIDDVEREAAAFTGLDSRHRYRIVSEGIDGSVILIRVTEDIDKERIRR